MTFAILFLFKLKKKKQQKLLIFINFFLFSLSSKKLPPLCYFQACWLIISPSQAGNVLEPDTRNAYIHNDVWRSKKTKISSQRVKEKSRIDVSVNSQTDDSLEEEEKKNSQAKEEEENCRGDIVGFGVN